MKIKLSLAIVTLLIGVVVAVNAHHLVSSVNQTSQSTIAELSGS